MNSHKPPKQRRASGSAREDFRRGATTFVELTCAMASVSVAAALLVPMLGAGSAESARLREAGNLRLISQLAFKYAADDPNGIIAPVHRDAINFVGEGYADYGGGPGTMSFFGWGDEFDPRTRPFNFYAYGFSPEVTYPQQIEQTTPGDRSLYTAFQCLGQDRGWQIWPGFFSGAGETDNSYFEANGTSFRQNNLQTSNGLSVGVYGRPKDRVPVPAQTLHYLESRVFQTLWTNDTWGFLDDQGELNGYHRKLGFFMVNYADGHYSFTDFGNGTYFERNPMLSSADVRGTWGRMDCFPERLLSVRGGSAESARGPLEPTPLTVMQRITP